MWFPNDQTRVDGGWLLAFLMSLEPNHYLLRISSTTVMKLRKS